MQGRLSRRFLEKGTVECRDILVGKLLQVHEWAEDVQPGMGRAEEAGVGRAEDVQALAGEGLVSASLVCQGNGPAFYAVEEKYWVRLCI